MRIFFLAFSIIFTTSFFAQPIDKVVNEGVISGKIIDKNSQQALNYVSFRLFSEKDSTVVAGIFSDEDGRFLLEQLPYGNYYAKLTFSGYTLKQIDGIAITKSMKILNLGTLKMEIDASIDLEEIKVVGKLDVLKAGIDKKVYNVGEDLSVKGGTANDILNNIPSVEVDQEGRIMLRGDGTVTILIDGRPSSLSGSNGKSLLDALPAGSIERIEVVTNPSAKYDPDGTSGIINIVLKKNKLKGFNGLITGNFGTGSSKNGSVFDGTASLSYRNSKVNLYGSYSARSLEGYRNNYSYLEQIFTVDSSLSIEQNRLGTDFNGGQTFRIGSDFYLKARNVLGVSLTGNVGQRDRTGEQWNVTADGNENRLALWKRDSYDPSNQQNFDFNTNYKYDFKKERGNLTADITHSRGNEKIKGFYDQYAYDLDSVLLPIQPIRQRLSNLEKTAITTGQLDVTYLFPKINSRMEAGTKMILREQTVDTYSESIDTLIGLFQEDTLANFTYAYSEQIYSAYAIYGQQIGRFKYQAGARIEKAYQIPNLISDSIRIVNDYFNFFPSAHIRYALSKKSEISLSYSRRINRATSGDLNPFTSYADPYNLRKGNPYLQPEFINSYDFGYTNEFSKMTLTASLFYRHTTGVITRIKEFYSDNTSAVTFANIDESHSIGSEIIIVYKPYKWWRNTLSANGNHIQYYDDNTAANFNRSGFNWNVKYAATIEFWKRTASIQVNAAYNAPRFTVQGKAQRKGPVDVSAEKKFKDGKWSLGMRVSDIFNKQGFYLTVDQPNIYQTANFKWLTRRFYINFTYKFGKLEMSNKSKSNGGGDGFDM